MPYYDIPSYAEYEGVWEPDFFEGACTQVACLIPEDKPASKSTESTNENDLDFPF